MNRNRNFLTELLSIVVAFVTSTFQTQRIIRAAKSATIRTRNQAAVLGLFGLILTSLMTTILYKDIKK